MRRRTVQYRLFRYGLYTRILRKKRILILKNRIRIMNSLHAYKIEISPASVTILLALFAFAASSNPVIEVSEMEFNAGTIKEGTQKHIQHKFIIKNTSDEELIVEKVRISCGCTVVKYDSVIAPGKSGVVEPEVDISGYTGFIEKSITVLSNAQNIPSLRLSLKVDIKPVIGISKNFLTMHAGGTVPVQVKLTTAKPDLAITGVECKPLSLKDRPQWREFSRSLRYVLTTSGQSDADSAHKYVLSLSIEEPLKKSMLVEFVIHTNHPEKNELRIRGIVE